MSYRKSKQVNFPHPIIKNPSLLKEYNINQSNQSVPYTFQPFRTSGQGNPCPHFLRSSSAQLGSYRQLDNILDMGVIAQPFSRCCAQVPLLQTQLRCDCCRQLLGVHNGMWSTHEVECVNCSSRRSLQAHQYEVAMVASKHSVIDYLLQTSPTEQRYVLLLQHSLEVSKYIHEVIQSLYALEKKNQIGLSIILYGKDIRLMDLRGAQPSCIRMSPSELILDSASQLFFSIEKLQTAIAALESLYEDSQPLVESCLESALLFIAGCMSECKLITLTSAAPVQLTPATRAEDSRFEEHYFKRDNYSEQLSGKLLSKQIEVSLFVFDVGHNYPLWRIVNYCEMTGGHLDVYRLHKGDVSESFYFDFYNQIQQQRISSIKGTVRTGGGIICEKVIIDSRKKVGQSFELAGFGPNRTITVCLKKDNKKQYQHSPFVRLQIQYKRGTQRRLRVISYKYSRSESLQTLIKSLGDQTLFFVTLRKLCAKQSKNQINNLCETMIEKLRKLIDVYRQASPSNFQFSIPNSLKFFCFYLWEISRRRIFSTKNINFTDMYLALRQFCTQNLQTLSKSLYMKLYNISTSRPIKNTRLLAHKIQCDSIYLLDSGIHLYVIIGQDITQSQIQQILGVKHLDMLFQMQVVPSTFHPLNRVVIEWINLLRQNNLNGSLILKPIRQGTSQYERVLADNLFNQDQYRRFLGRLL